MNYTKGKISAIDTDSEGRFVFRVAKVDASLFKAAPDMYEALKYLKGLNTISEKWTIAQKLMNNALAKAEGGEK